MGSSVVDAERGGARGAHGRTDRAPWPWTRSRWAPSGVSRWVSRWWRASHSAATGDGRPSRRRVRSGVEEDPSGRWTRPWCLWCQLRPPGFVPRSALDEVGEGVDEALDIVDVPEGVRRVRGRQGHKRLLPQSTSNSESLSDHRCVKKDPSTLRETLKRDDHLGPNEMSF